MTRLFNPKAGLVALVAALLVGAFYALPRPHDAVASTVTRDDDLEEAMESINHALKSLNKTITDKAKTKAVLADLGRLESNLIKAKGEIPHTIREMQGKKKHAAIIDYRKMLMSAVEKAFDMERAVLDGKRADAKKMIRAMIQIRNKGHEKYKGEEEDDD